jgi:hypothetical protein
MNTFNFYHLENHLDILLLLYNCTGEICEAERCRLCRFDSRECITAAVVGRCATLPATFYRQIQKNEHTFQVFSPTYETQVA